MVEMTPFEKRIAEMDAKYKDRLGYYVAVRTRDMDLLLAAVKRMREKLEWAKNEYWNKCYEGTGNVKALSVADFARGLSLTDLNALAEGDGK